jgi:hypothetical protein
MLLSYFLYATRNHCLKPRMELQTKREHTGMSTNAILFRGALFPP